MKETTDETARRSDGAHDDENGGTVKRESGRGGCRETARPDQRRRQRQGRRRRGAGCALRRIGRSADGVNEFSTSRALPVEFDEDHYRQRRGAESIAHWTFDRRSSYALMRGAVKSSAAIRMERDVCRGTRSMVGNGDRRAHSSRREWRFDERKRTAESVCSKSGTMPSVGVPSQRARRHSSAAIRRSIAASCLRGISLMSGQETAPSIVRRRSEDDWISGTACARRHSSPSLIARRPSGSRIVSRLYCESMIRSRTSRRSSLFTLCRDATSSDARSSCDSRIVSSIPRGVG